MATLDYDTLAFDLQLSPVLKLLKAEHAALLVPIASVLNHLHVCRFPYPCSSLLSVTSANYYPERSVFYWEDIAPYWILLKRALETSFTSQFSKTEEALHAIAKTRDAYLDRLLDESIDSE